MPAPNSLLLVTHVPIRQAPGGALRIDDQTAAGIRQWCRHFDRVTYLGIADAGEPGAGWVGPQDGVARLERLPRAYSVHGMARHYRPVRRRLRALIADHAHLCFTVGGLVGDWPALAAMEAIAQRRRFGAWIDVVEPSLIRVKAAGAGLPKRLAAAAIIPAMERYTRHILRGSSVALLQGRDTFDHYARWASDPHCTYDTHTQAADRIASDALAAKQTRILSGAPLRIVYAGRAAAQKGPGDWLEVIERLHRAGVPLRAAWLGDGPELPAMRERVMRAGLGEVVELAGFVGDREALLGRLRDGDLLLFCHKTAESARCLVEALVCGCPLAGYGQGYPRGLVERHGGGVFAPPDDTAALAERVTALHRDRPALARLVADAAASGGLYDEDTLYAHRAGLMRRG